MKSLAENPIPLRDFFKNPQSKDFKVSPHDGFIAFMKPWQNRNNVFVQQLSKNRQPIGDPRQITFVKDRDIMGFNWKGDSTILYEKDFGGDENFHIFAVDINTGDEKDLTPFVNVRAHLIEDLAKISDTDVLIETNQRTPEIFDVYRVNTVTGEMRMVAQNTGQINSWLADHQGQVRVATEADGLTTKIYARDSEQDQFRKIMEFSFEHDLHPLCFTSDNTQLFVSSNLTRDKKAIVKIDLLDGAEIELIYAHPDVDVTMLNYSKQRKVITNAIFTAWKKEQHFFDLHSKKLYEKIKNKIGEAEFVFNSSNEKEDLYTLLVTDDKTLARNYLYDVQRDHLALLYDSTEFLPPEKLASMQPIKYTARDGLTIHGYLTLPVGSNGKNLPVVINPHGGPWARNVWGFNPEVQFLANRGYAVLQMNFRGSVGYGKDFYTKSFKQWGRTMQDDITDGVSWLIAEGIADPARIAIYGVSYGGYAALAGITLTPDLYACAIDFVGISNLFTFMNTNPPYWKSWLSQCKAMVGDPITDYDLLMAVSPVHNADKITAPLFVAQGAKDPRVNIDESDQIVASLRKRGVDVKYMVKENEGHGFRNEENRFEFYAEMEKFLEQHLG